jgi:hypothetical protein
VPQESQALRRVPPGRCRGASRRSRGHAWLDDGCRWRSRHGRLSARRGRSYAPPTGAVVISRACCSVGRSGNLYSILTTAFRLFHIAAAGCLPWRQLAAASLCLPPLEASAYRAGTSGGPAGPSIPPPVWCLRPRARLHHPCQHPPVVPICYNMRIGGLRPPVRPLVAPRRVSAGVGRPGGMLGWCSGPRAAL